MLTDPLLSLITCCHALKALPMSHNDINMPGVVRLGRRGVSAVVSRCWRNECVPAFSAAGVAPYHRRLEQLFRAGVFLVDLFVAEALCTGRARAERLAVADELNRFNACEHLVWDDLAVGALE